MPLLRGIAWRALPNLLRPKKSLGSGEPLTVFLCIADHFEPMWLGAPPAIQRERVDRWVHEYPRRFSRFGDSAGRPPQHTFFYPAEEYRAENIDRLADLCGQGFGAVEVHLHHDSDTSDNLRETLTEFKETLFHKHGLLGKNAAGEITYGFVHGNWALDNSHPDGRWCGVNDEITVLRETGCYADFTMPSAPDPCQTTTVNSIYYAVDDSCRPKSHDRGQRAKAGQVPPRDGLLMIQGPLMLDWQRRKWGLLPRLENGEVSDKRLPTVQRLRRWVSARVSVAGRPDWLFVKLHAHGAQEGNAAVLLGEPMERFHQELAAVAARTPGFRYFYVTAREMADLVRQAEAGLAEPMIAHDAHRKAEVSSET